MKKLLFLLTLLAVIGCSPDRVLQEELINKGTEESPMLFYAGEPFTGIAFDVYPNGQLKKPEFTIKDGRPDGYYVTQLQNGGELRSNWKDGELDGSFQRLDVNNRIIEDSHYKNGLLNGYSETYFNDGVKSSGRYKNGKKDGEWKLWSSDGYEISLDIYEDGELIYYSH